MLTTSQIQSASDLLYTTWSSRDRIAHLPDKCRPSSRAEGYAIQSRLEARSARPLFGWKIAATSEAGQKHIGVNGPMAGRILHERVLPDGSDVSLTGNQMKVAEIEFAFRMGRDLVPRSSRYDVGEVLAAVGSLHPAIEIPDSRYLDFVHAGECQLIADNACAHQFILGAATGADWRSIDLSLFQVAVNHQHHGKDQALTGLGANVLGDPRIALTWIANELTQIGIPLKKDQVVTTGTCLTPIIVEAGDRVFGDYGVLGKVSAHFID